jgi:hypothetical protein
MVICMQVTTILVVVAIEFFPHIFSMDFKCANEINKCI